jgi:hypothetical protein
MRSMKNVIYIMVDMIFKALVIMLVVLFCLWLGVLNPLDRAEREELRAEILGAVANEDWEIKLSPEIPVCLVWEMDESGKIISSNFQYYEGMDALSLTALYDVGAGFEEKLSGALGNVLEPLRDRYPLIGRTITFGHIVERLAGGNWLAVAYWQPLVTRVYWLAYVAIIYLYLAYWAFAPIWVYADSRRNGLPLSAFIILAGVANIVGVIAYLVWKRKYQRIPED